MRGDRWGDKLGGGIVRGDSEGVGGQVGGQ